MVVGVRREAAQVFLTDLQRTLDRDQAGVVIRFIADLNFHGDVASEKRDHRIIARPISLTPYKRSRDRN